MNKSLPCFRTPAAVNAAIARFDRCAGEAITAEPRFTLGTTGFLYDTCHLTLAEKTWTFTPEHQHPVYQLAYVVKGRVTIHCDEVSTSLVPECSELVLIPPSTLHWFSYGNDEQNLYISLSFSLSALNPQGRAFCQTFPQILADRDFVVSLSPFQKCLLDMLVEKCASEDSVRYLSMAGPLLKTFLFHLFGENFPELFQSNPDAVVPSRAERVDFIRHRIANRMNSRKPPVAFVARCCHLSSRHVNRLFKEGTGMTITEYWLQKKLELARDLLQSTNLPLGEIGRTLGFRKPAPFCDFIRRHFGKTPTEIREKR